MNMKTTDLGGEVLDTLDQLDTAVRRARDLFKDVFVRLLRHRFPVGSTVDLSQVTVLHGHAHGATHARVMGHYLPDIALGRPEKTRLKIAAVALRKDGTETANELQLSEPLLGRKYELGLSFDEKALPEREQLTKLIEEMLEAEASLSVEAEPTP